MTHELESNVENHPNLKSDKHISTLLNQIEESQNTILDSNLLYNQYVTYYNSVIYSFPANIF
ncbi:LemA family protein [Lihuaxuella thermophila]|uniref:LemA family protein n=1 Tax=Lihuaxuella thermophila TaxID=1173111 RepID=UPI000B7E6771